MSDSINKPMRVLAEYAAQKLFQSRAKGKKEVRLSEEELATAMAAVAQAAWTACFEAVQRVRERTDREIEEENGE